MTFAQRIAAIRKNKKLSQEKLGEMVNVSQRTVAFWESGHRMPSNAVLTDLACKLDVSVDYLLGLSDEPKRKEPATLPDDELRKHTLNRIEALPEPVLLKMLDLMDAIQACQGTDSASAAVPDSSDKSSPE